MPVFNYRFIVPAPIEAVREFHSDTSALKRLTPPPTIVQLHGIEPLAEGSVSEFTLWVGPLPLKWRAIHRNVSATGFTDIQTQGPAGKWEHTHTFHPLTEDKTEIREHIEYEHQAGILGSHYAAPVLKTQPLPIVYVQTVRHEMVPAPGFRFSQISHRKADAVAAVFE